MAPPKPLRRDPLPRRVSPELDDTVRIVPPAVRRHRFIAPVIAGCVAVLVIIGGGVWFMTRPAPFPLADEQVIFHHSGTHFSVFRFADDPLVLVIDCPGLHAQGMMFDRIAALIEKTGAPKDRVLSMAAFRATLTAADSTIGTYYYGDDYPAKALRKFFRLAKAEHIALTGEERHLRGIARQAGFLTPGENGAVISIPQAGPQHRVGLRARAVILRHELSHGAYFTIQAYHAFVHHFYDTALTGAEQADFAVFLEHQGYDRQDHGLIVNETIAYLIFTRDREFFRGEAVGLAPARLAALRAEFVAMMPDIWLQRLATTPLPSG